MIKVPKENEQWVPHVFCFSLLAQSFANLCNTESVQGLPKPQIKAEPMDESLDIQEFESQREEKENIKQEISGLLFEISTLFLLKSVSSKYAILFVDKISALKPMI